MTHDETKLLGERKQTRTQKLPVYSVHKQAIKGSFSYQNSLKKNMLPNTITGFCDFSKLIMKMLTSYNEYYKFSGL